MQLYRFPVFCVSVSRAMVRKGWSSLDVPSGWVQIIRGPRPPSQRWPKSSEQKPTIGRWQNHQNQEAKVPTMPRQVRVGPSAARDLAKNKIVQLERALEAMGGHGGSCSASHQVGIGEGQDSFQEASVERGDRGGPKVHHTFHATSEGDGGRTSGGGTFVVGGTRESQEDVGGAGEGSQPPSPVTGRNFTDNRPPTDGEHVAGRTRQSGGGVAISREDAAGGEVTPSTEFRRGSREPPRTSSQKASVWSRGHPEFRAGVDRMDVHEAFRVARCFGIGPNELVVEI